MCYCTSLCKRVGLGSPLAACLMYGDLTSTVHIVNNFHWFVIIKRMYVLVFEDHMLDCLRAKCVFVFFLPQSNWSYNGLNLEIVDSFSYLGIKFTSNGSQEAGVKALSDQALRAVNNLLGLFRRVYFDIKTKLALFDALVTPILLYNAEGWGLYDFPHIDKIHIKFCKILLGVRQQTPNYAVYGELGRCPLSVIAKDRAAKFWLKILGNTDSLIHKIFQDQVYEIENRLITNRSTAKKHWASLIKSYIETLGFPDMWWDHFMHAPNFQIIKPRIRDHFLQHWCAQINNLSKLE